ncbi:Bud-site selection protein [Apiospora marii]|uniref:Bud-site selection protein n=1 Tax=Apiospora marii TaxID=335849 RepID=A0ABR1RYL0_9PEZI
MVKRKRYEPKLDEQLQALEVKLFRALKTSKGFERQRMAKRVQEETNPGKAERQRQAKKGHAPDPEKVARLEREVAVLKSLDLHQAAHAILCSQLLKVKGIAESPNLPETIKPVPKPNITEEERSALHNVTSGLCNRKQVKSVLDEAVKATCLALRVDLPGKGGKGKAAREEPEEQADDREEKPARKAKTAADSSKSKSQKKPANSDDEESEDEWGGVSGDEGHASDDEEEEEKALSRYEALLGGSSDSEGDDLNDEDELQDSRAATIKKGSQAEVRGPSDYFSGGESDADEDDLPVDLSADEEEEKSEEEEEGEESDGSDSSEAVSPPPKKARASKASVSKNGESAFLPSLMGGYVSGSESEASDLDVAPTRNNRRGQRARQAIWEKKFKQEARHLNKPKDSRDDGWDAKRGAVGNEHGAPWKQGIKSAFDKRDKPSGPAPEGVHPDRQRHFNESGPPHRNSRDSAQSKLPHRSFGGSAGPSRSFEPAAAAAPKPPPKPVKPKRDDTGPLHATWEMAKAQKEKMQSAKFEGKKITFD